MQVEAGGVQVPGLSPQAGLGCSRQAGGAAACIRQSRKSQRAAFCKEEVRRKAASTQHPGTSQCPNQRRAWAEGWHGARLDRRSLSVQEEGRKEAAREPWAAQGGGGEGVWGGCWWQRGLELGEEMLHLHPFLLSKPSCSSLDFSRIAPVMREKKSKSNSSIRPLFFVLHTPSSLGGRGMGVPHPYLPHLGQSLSPMLCPGAEPALTGPQVPWEKPCLQTCN